MKNDTAMIIRIPRNETGKKSINKETTITTPSRFPVSSSQTQMISATTKQTTIPTIHKAKKATAELSTWIMTHQMFIKCF
jgi:hypothetical protein